MCPVEGCWGPILPFGSCRLGHFWPIGPGVKFQTSGEGKSMPQVKAMGSIPKNVKKYFTRIFIPYRNDQGKNFGIYFPRACAVRAVRAAP